MKRNFLKLKFLSGIFVLLLSLLLISCENLQAFSDFAKVIDDFTSTKVTFYTYKEEDTLPEGQQIKTLFQKYPIGTVLTQDNLIDFDIPDLTDVRPHYRVGGWSMYRYSNDKTKPLPEAGQSAVNYTVTGDPVDVVAEWHYEYTVNFYYEKISENISGVISGSSGTEPEYELVNSEIRYGKPDELTNVVPPEAVGFTVQPVSQIVIKEGQENVINVRYDRKTVSVTLNPNGGKFRLRRSSASEEIQYSTEPIVVSGKYGYLIDSNPSLETYYRLEPVHDEQKFYGYLPQFTHFYPSEDTEYVAQWAPPVFSINYYDYSEMVLQKTYSGIISQEGVSYLPEAHTTGQKTYVPFAIPKSCSENVVSFVKWYYYTQSEFEFLSRDTLHVLPSDGTGYYIPQEIHDNIYILAEWNYKYIYCMPQENEGSFTIDKSGMSPDDAVSTIQEAVSIFQNCSNTEAIILTGPCTDYRNILSMNSITNKQSVFKRYKNYKGPLIDYTQKDGDPNITIAGIILDGGAEWNMNDPATKINTGIKSEAPLIVLNNASNVTLSDISGSYQLILQNNDIELISLPDGYEAMPSAIYTNGNPLSAEKIVVQRCASTVSGLNQPTVYAAGHAGYNLQNCVIQNNISDGLWIYPEDGESLTLSGTIIKNNVNYGIRSFGNLLMSNPDYNVFENTGSDFYIPQNKNVTISQNIYHTISFYLDCEEDNSGSNAYIILTSGFTSSGTTVAKVKVPYPQITPKVLNGDTSDVSANYKKFLCLNEGYSINYAGNIVESQDVTIEPVTPLVTQYDLGHFEGTVSGEIPKTVTVKKQGSGNAKIKFILNAEIMNYIKDWGGGNKYLQYTIDAYYSCSEIIFDGTNYYAEIDFIMRRNEPNGTQYQLNLTSGLHNLSVFADALDSETTAFNAVALKALYIAE